MKVLVTGGRDYNDKREIFAKLDKLHEDEPITLLFHGNAWGLDYLAGQWALKNEIMVFIVPAQWSKYGDKAGSIRNVDMYDIAVDENVNVLLRFKGGHGTQHMEDYVREAGGMEIKDMR